MISISEYSGTSSKNKSFKKGQRVKHLLTLDIGTVLRKGAISFDTRYYVAWDEVNPDCATGGHYFKNELISADWRYV